MPNNIERVVRVNITRDLSAASETELNLPLILAKNAPLVDWTAATKEYTNADDVAEDFGSSSDEFKAASALLAPDVKVPKFIIALRDAAVAQVKEIDFDINLTASTQAINCTINGVKLSQTPFDTDMATTLTALAAKIAAVAGITSAVTGTKKITVTATAEYNLDISCSVSGTPTVNVTVVVDTAGHNIVDDYLAAKAEDDNHYCVLTVDKNLGAVDSLARYLQGKMKMFGYSTDDSNVIANVTTDIFSRQKDLKLSRTHGMYHNDTTTHPEFTLNGLALAYAPGKISWSHKTLPGIATVTMSDAQYNYTTAKYGVTYTKIDKDGDTGIARSFDGSPIFINRDIDYLQLIMQSRVYSQIKKAKKFDYSQANIDNVENTLRGVFKFMINNDIISDDVGYQYTLTMPKMADVSASDRVNNILKNITWTAYVRTEIGYIQIDGTISI